jgi:hypothetical protein
MGVGTSVERSSGSYHSNTKQSHSPLSTRSIILLLLFPIVISLSLRHGSSWSQVKQGVKIMSQWQWQWQWLTGGAIFLAGESTPRGEDIVWRTDDYFLLYIVIFCPSQIWEIFQCVRFLAGRWIFPRGVHCPLSASVCNKKLTANNI